MSPSGFRTATAQLDGPRIITPSRTAWPPRVVIGRRFQTDARAKPARPEVGAASGASEERPVLRGSSSVGAFRGTCEQSPRVLTWAPQASPQKDGVPAECRHEELRLAAAGAAGLL